MFLSRVTISHKLQIDLDLIQQANYRYKFAKTAEISEDTKAVVFFAKEVVFPSDLSAQQKVVKIPSLTIPSYPSSGLPSTRGGRGVFLIFADAQGHYLCYVDVYGNIYFPPFHLLNKPCPNFREIFSFVSGFFHNYLEAELLRIVDWAAAYNPSRIRRIVVEEEFDKATFLEKVTAEAYAAAEKAKEIVTAQYKARIDALTKRLQVLEQKLNSSQQFLEGFRTAFEVIDLYDARPYVDGRDIIIPCTIKALYIKRNLKLVKAPDGVFFLRNLIITPSGKILIQEAFHPNVDATSNADPCLGTLRGRPLHEVLKKLPSTFSTCNLDSAYSGAAEKEALKIWKREVEAGNYVTLDNILHKTGG